MPASALQRCGDDEERCLCRLATYCKYRVTHLEACRNKGRQQMARLRVSLTDAQREKHCAAQKRYREKYAPRHTYREQIAHRARRAAVERNAKAGRELKLQPKARQYWSDPEQVSDEEHKEFDEW
ncbi:hypothetical protein B0H19DRAFT_1055728 [Mycena capillaripes]|nr:hypothetical protein B0H19DRAFT_1055728 [Mycena capillaripes]